MQLNNNVERKVKEVDPYRVLKINRYENSGRTPLEEDRYIKSRADSMMKKLGEDIEKEKENRQR